MTICKYLKKYLGGLILMLLVFSYSYSAIMPENDWKDKELKGKVKTMTETTYNYGYSGKDNEVNKKKTIFNKNGYIIEELHYAKNSKEPYSYKKRYNDKGLLIESHEHTYSYEYDKTGNLVQTKRTKYETYRTLEKTTYNKTGKIIRTQTYTQNLYDKAGVKMTDDSNYFKDKNGNLTYQVANRIEVEDITTGKGSEKGIYEKKVIEYEYYN